MTERLYLYALVRPDGRWGYVGATVNPKRRAQNWAYDRPGERFQVLMIGDEKYVLAMERKLIRHCWQPRQPITNCRASNRPLPLYRRAPRRDRSRWINHEYRHLARGVVNPKCAFCIAPVVD